MKTLIFLSQRRYEHYNFENQPDTLRRVCILSKKNSMTFPPSQKRYFSEMYIASEEKDCGKLAGYTLSLTDVESIVTKECELAGGSHQVRLICSDEANVSLAGYLRDKLAIPGPSYDDVLYYRNKVLMKERLVEDNVRTPHFMHFDKNKALLNSAAYYQQMMSLVGEKFIIKPVDGAASSITSIIHNYDEFKKVSKQLEHSDDTYEAEEFIEGELYHCDIVVQDGQVVLMLTSEYFHPNLSFLYGEVLGSMPLSNDNPLKAKIEAFSEDVVRSLGSFDGVRHLEVFVSNSDEIIFLEVGARPPGAITVPTYQKNYNINLLDVDMAIALEKKVGKLDSNFVNYCLWGFLPNGSQAYKDTFKPKLKGTMDIHWINRGDEKKTSSSQSVRDYAAYFYVCCDSHSDLKADFDELKQFKFNLEP